jgi:hypothetical protein
MRHATAMRQGAGTLAWATLCTGILAPSFLSATACTRDSPSPANPAGMPSEGRGPLSEGVWGGLGAEIRVDASSAYVHQLDGCGAALLPRPLLDSAGHFRIEGAYGGPHGTPGSFPAVFEGWVASSTMTLRVSRQPDPTVPVSYDSSSGAPRATAQFC